MLVVLNDNCMSIDPNVGALKEYLTDITTSKAYNKAKEMLSKKHPQARETKVRYSQTGGKAVCRLYWEKD